jgi:site-specific recombinase XerD
MNSYVQLVKVTLPEGKRQTTVLSSGERIELSLRSTPNPVYSVVDGKGSIVRSAHEWLSYLGRLAGLTYSAGTIEQYARTLTYLCRWIEEDRPYENLSIDENIKLLDRQDIVQWLSDMESQGVRSKKTLHAREAGVRQFLDWLTTQDGGCVRDLKSSPWGRDGQLPYVIARPNARSPKYVSAEVIVELLNGMHNECERCMFHAQYDMGLRISELIALRLGDLPEEHLFDQALAFIPICISGVKGRGGQKKERITLISRAVLKRIKRYHSTREYKLAPDWDIDDPDKPAFLTANQAQWTRRNASKQFKRSVRRMGLPGSLRTHWLRHGTAYSVLRSDIGRGYEDRMLMIQQMFGHTNLSTTEIYTQISPALLESLTKEGKAINRLGEAERIRESTYLGPLQHKERRGHRG